MMKIEYAKLVIQNVCIEDSSNEWMMLINFFKSKLNLLLHKHFPSSIPMYKERSWQQMTFIFHAVLLPISMLNWFIVIYFVTNCYQFLVFSVSIYYDDSIRVKEKDFQFFAFIHSHRNSSFTFEETFFFLVSESAEKKIVAVAKKQFETPYGAIEIFISILCHKWKILGGIVFHIFSFSFYVNQPE